MPDSRSDYPTRPSWNDVDDGLDSWKDIAAYLERTVVTVQRWEKEEGLPVHRHLHNKQATVYASRSEIDTWLERRRRVLEDDRPGWFRFFSKNRKTVVGVAAGVTLLLLVGLVVLERVTTPSLQALQLFTKADALLSQGRSDLAEELLKQALEIDPEFASAHIYLAHALRNQRKPAEEYLPFAEKAFQLAETTGQRERYFIHGSYYDMKGEQEKAVQAYETLLPLYPDHFWAVNNLAYYFSSVGQEQRALAYTSRSADLRPNNFKGNMRAASDLIHFGSNLPRARKYLDRARNLLTDDIIREGSSSVVKLMLSLAQEAWLGGDPETALAEIGKVSQKLESLGISGHAMLPLATLYYSVGKVQLAHRLFTDSLDKRSPIRGLHQLALYYEATKPNLRLYLGISEGSISHLTIPGGRPSLASLNAAIALAQAGFIEQSEALLTEYERAPNIRPFLRTYFQIARGVLSLSKENTTEGIRLIEDALGQAHGSYFLGSLILAEAWREQNQLELTMRVLEQASSKKALLFAPVGGENPARWLRIRLMLAETYREMGRDEDAQKIEAELRSLLAYADADHPILRQLEPTTTTAFQQAAN